MQHPSITTITAEQATVLLEEVLDKASADVQFLTATGVEDHDLSIGVHTSTLTAVGFTVYDADDREVGEFEIIVRAVTA